MNPPLKPATMRDSQVEGVLSAVVAGPPSGNRVPGTYRKRSRVGSIHSSETAPPSRAAVASAGDPGTDFHGSPAGARRARTDEPVNLDTAVPVLGVDADSDTGTDSATREPKALLTFVGLGVAP